MMKKVFLDTNILINHLARRGQVLRTSRTNSAAGAGT